MHCAVTWKRFFLLFTKPSFFFSLVLPSRSFFLSCSFFYLSHTYKYMDTRIHFKHLALSQTTKCLDDIQHWMSNNSLHLNGGKSEVILIGTPHQTKKAGITHITINGHPTPLSSLVTNLGVKLDSSLSFDAHIKSICQTSFYHLRNISRLRPSLPKHAAEKLVHAFISSRLDYCNSLLAGLPAKTI